MIDSRLITFLTVARIKNFTRTGTILNLTQPAVSQQIKFLENYYQVNLIRKHGRGINLTEEGEILFKYVEKLEILYRALEMELKNESAIRRVYNIGATMTIGEYILPYILGKYKQQYGAIDIILQVNNTKEITEKLLSRKIDLALVEGPFDKRKFNHKKLKDDELVLAVSPQHEFCQKKSVDLEEVVRGKLILREKGSGTRAVFEKKLRELAVGLVENLNVYMELGSINAIKSLVEANLGYTIISREAIKREVELGTITVVPIQNAKFFREFNFIYLDGIAEELVNHFIKFCYFHFK